MLLQNDKVTKTHPPKPQTKPNQTNQPTKTWNRETRASTQGGLRNECPVDGWTGDPGSNQLRWREEGRLASGDSGDPGKKITAVELL